MLVHEFPISDSTFMIDQSDTKKNMDSQQPSCETPMETIIEQVPTNTPEPQPEQVPQPTLQPSFVAAELPKACPPDPLISLLTAEPGTVYPNPSTYQFLLSKPKRVDRHLSVYFVGINDKYQRQWSFIIPSPPCFVTFTNVYKGEAPNTRALLCPMYGDGTKPEDPAPMISFLNHVEAISDLLKDKLIEKDNNAQNWMSPLKIQDGFLMGMNVKVKSDNFKKSK